MRSLKNVKSAAVLMVSLLNLQPVFAQSASDLLCAVKTSKSIGSATVQVAALSGQTIVTLTADTFSDDSVKDSAITIAKLVATDKTNVKPLTVLFTNKANKVREVSFSSAQMAEIAGGASKVGFSINDAEEAADNQTQVAAAPAASGKYQIERTKVAARIEALRAKGVGVTPFARELARVDDSYSHGADTTAMLAKLDSTLTEQEKYRQEMQIEAAAKSISHVPSAQTSQSLAYSLRASKVIKALAPTGGSSSDASVADYSGSMDGFVSQMLTSVVAKEVGSFVPHKGPFLVERFRIAKRIHELEGRNMRVDGVANLYRNMEEVVVTQDPRRLAELSGDVKYLQSQLGLGELQGSLHRPLGI